MSFIDFSGGLRKVLLVYKETPIHQTGLESSDSQLNSDSQTPLNPSLFLWHQSFPYFLSLSSIPATLPHKTKAQVVLPSSKLVDTKPTTDQRLKSKAILSQTKMDPDDEVKCPGAASTEPDEESECPGKAEQGYPFPGFEEGEGFGGELSEGFYDDDDDDDDDY
jgi:hypothetical protein